MDKNVGDRLEGILIDLKVSIDGAAVESVLQEGIDVETVLGVQAARHALTHQDFDVALLDFDFPQRFTLTDVAQLKRDFPSVPMVMLSIEHSEALVLWAFRSRLWDFFAKPIDADEWARCLQSLRTVRRQRAAQPRRELAQARTQTPPDQISDGLPLLKAVYFIESHFDEEVRSDDLARLCGMSTFHFSRVFKETFGIGVREYVLRRRLTEARKLAARGELSVASICYAVGFNDPAYFSRAFKRFFGITPTQSLGTPVPEKLLEQAELRLVVHE